MKKYIIPICLSLILLWLAFGKISNVGLTEEFKSRQDSLIAAVDSMEIEIEKYDSTVKVLDRIDDSLQYVVDHQKAKVIKDVEIVEIEKNKVDSYSEIELISSFNKRYPEDTLTSLLPLAQPVLVSAAKDLVELDGAKQIIVLKDSSIYTLESRVANKDSIISKFEAKEKNYKGIILNQDTQLKDWKFEYNNLQLQNQRLKIKSKVAKVGAGLVTGGLIYLLLAK